MTMIDPELLDRIRLLASRTPDLSKLAPALSAELSQAPPQLRFDLMAQAAGAHPFFVPKLSAADEAAVTVDQAQFARVAFAARHTAARPASPRLLVACPPKTGSSFLSHVLGLALRLRQASLATTSFTLDGSSSLGANLREQEIDELALLKRCLENGGFVAQHHVRATPYLAQQLRTYGVTPVLTSRNIFDAFISLDDMYCAWRRRAESEHHFLNDAMPRTYLDLPLEQRLELLLDRWLFWYVQFEASWRKSAAAKFVAPVWISYEDDIAPGIDALADAVATRLPQLGLSHAQVREAAETVAGSDYSRINKGVTGRGAAFPKRLRERVMRVIAHYADEVDLSALLAEPGDTAQAA